MSRKSQIFGLCLFVCSFLMLNGWMIEQGNSQTKYPTRAIDLIVPYPPGGSTDLAGRIMAPFLSKKWSVPVNVINKSGGKSIPACFDVFHATSNGYTMLVDSQNSSTFMVIGEKNLPFDIMERSFIGSYCTAPYLLYVAGDSPLKTLEDVIKECKNNPQNITYTSLGGTTAIELAIRQFFAAVGADIKKTKPVLFSGGSDALVVVAGGHVVLGAGSTSTVLPSINGKTIRAFFITSKERDPQLPNIPTSQEVGLPQVTASTWVGISGPPKLPSNIVQVWNDAFKEMVKDPAIISQLAKIGAVPFYLDGQGVKNFISRDLADIKKYWQ
jgi:tripartite-type tricarboxylate transporter receptor subunit TctC